jgi:arsenite methyltransferase
MDVLSAESCGWGRGPVTPSEPPAEALVEAVRERYGAIGGRAAGCCGGSATQSCCGESADGAEGSASCCAESLGYTAAELAILPAGAYLGLGCGNPTALLALQEGEVVLDLGSGAGVDCFLAAQRVGPRGRVIGVDMTPEMVARARKLAREHGRTNVEFRLGEIDHLPVADQSVDVVVSNCVINLVPDQQEVYREAYRVLRPGGRLAVSDVVATRPVPEELRHDPVRWASCSSGALEAKEIADLLGSAGFVDVTVEVPGRPETGAPPSLRAQDDLSIVPGSIHARKPSDG